MDTFENHETSISNQNTTIQKTRCTFKNKVQTVLGGIQPSNTTIQKTQCTFKNKVQMCCPNLRSQDKTRTAFEKATCSSSSRSRSSSSSSSTAYSLQRLALKQPSAHCAKRADNTFSNRQRLEDHSAHAPAQRVAALIFGARSGAIVVNTCR